MWILLELLPEIFSLLKKTKHDTRNDFLFFLFFLFFIAIFFSAAFYKSFIVSISLFFIAVVVIYYTRLTNYKSKENNNVDLLSLELVEGEEVFLISYSNIWGNTDIVKDSQINKAIQIRLPRLGQPISLLINGNIIKSNDIPHLKILILGITFRKYFFDSLKRKYLIDIRIWGIFKPRIILKVNKV